MSNKAIVFAGQGAQFVGMGKDLAEAYPECADLFKKADDVLGYELSKICFEGPEEELIKTNNCQPAIFVTSIACYKAFCLEKGDVEFAGTAGLSLGEWSALHMAGALSFEDTLKVLEARGRFMQDACDEKDGTMISIIGLDSAKVKEIAESAGVGLANFNSAAQIVLSGERAKIEEAEKLAKDAGAKRAIILNVAGAYHSPLMSSAAEKLEKVLADVEIAEPKVPVISNVTGLPHGDPASIRENMIKQVTSSVLWLGTIEWFKNNGVSEYIECGPGKVLSGLVRRIDKEASLGNIQGVDSLNKIVNS